jgi:hypothetical protein
MVSFLKTEECPGLQIFGSWVSSGREAEAMSTLDVNNRDYESSKYTTR